MTISLVVILSLMSLVIWSQFNLTNVSAQPNSSNDFGSETIFDKIINGESIPEPDIFLESQGSFIPDAPFDPDRANFMAEIGPVRVFSDNIKNNTKIIDFDQVPATTPPDFMRFMPPYQVAFYVYNRDAQNITINSIRISEVVSKQNYSPFELCGVSYDDISIRLLPGETQSFLICYFPKVTGNSSANLQFYHDSRLIFEIPLKGNGVTPTSMPGEMGLTEEIRNESRDETTNATANTSNRIGNLPTEITNLTSDTPSFLIKPMTECSLTIEGGGQRPNPNVLVDRYGPFNTEPLDPPDDGIEMNQTGVYHHKINVGQLVTLQARVSGISSESIESIRWTIADPNIKDYDVYTPGKFVTYNLTGEDYLRPAISFYWRDVGEKEVTATVEEIVNNNQSMKCSASRIFSVERNDNDINRQATDFYTFNHNATILERHSNWHRNNPQILECDPSDNGEDFFLYHKRVMSNFDAWRETFGYSTIIAWDPATDPPTGKDLDNENRNPIYSSEPIPPFFTIEGRTQGTPEGTGPIKSVCSDPYNKGNNQTITKLSDFISADHLASELEATWHGRVHVSIGGEMSDFYIAPKDPVFWMWHKYIDTVYDKYKGINGN